MVAKREERDDCEQCEEHKAWEERMKLLDTIPSLLSWKNQSKGALYVIGVLVPIIFAIVVGTRAELFTKIKDHEDLLNSKQDRMVEQVAAIGKDAAAIRTDVAVLVRTTDLRQKDTEKDIAILRSYHTAR